MGSDLYDQEYLKKLNRMPKMEINPDIKDSHLQSITQYEQQFQKVEKSRSRVRIWKYGVIAVTAAMLLYLLFNTDNGRRLATDIWEGLSDTLKEKEADHTITDPFTVPNLEKVKLEDGMSVVDYKTDNMERGDNPYNYLLRSLVISQEFDGEDLSRGDVVYYVEPGDTFQDIQSDNNRIARIIAMPGESIEIVKGQVFINDKKLDTFYGDGSSNFRNLDHMKEYNFAKMTVPDGHYFLMGDLWWRSVDSRKYGPVPIDNMIGLVEGYR
ncbi:signal peptidase I [Bacillus tianshenii]|uniref:Signal peptidase I n=1 Tax=Sutcliffiella tianshenii TaxID=1463404 RepID=A0ABS2P3A5_9BACI|nr:signal peptidase I [Bacillus tianshenii]MBM7621188.1 signal peptidase I [Bacillus tianshenii]